MVFNATFNNISAISWRSVLLMEETRVTRENHWPAASHWQTLSHNVVSSTPHMSGILINNAKIWKLLEWSYIFIWDAFIFGNIYSKRLSHCNIFIPFRTTDFKDSNHELYVAWEPVNKIRSEIKEVIS
jgi:hypothetical protein